MWLDTENKQDPYNRLTAAPQTPATSIGAGAGAAQPGTTNGTTSNPSTQTPVQSNQPTQNFASVQDYLGSNQQQGEQLGQQFTNKLDTAATRDTNAIAGAATQTKNDIASNTVGYDANLVNNAVKDPTKVAGDSGQLDSFLKQWNASYQGPQSFESSANYGTAADAATDAGNKQAQLKTAGGQQQILQDEFGVYGQGNKGLDQALLQTSTAYPKVQDSVNKFGQIQDYLGQQANDVNTAATQAKDTTNATKQQTQGAFTNNLTNFQNDLGSRVATAQGTEKAASDKYQQDLSSGNVAAVTSDLREAGATPDQVKSVNDYLDNLNRNYGVTPNLTNQFAFNPMVDINAANVATKQDYDKAAAYNKLTGVDYSGVLNPNDVSKAGTAAQAKTGLNTAGVQDYLKTQLGQQDQALLTSSDPQAFVKDVDAGNMSADATAKLAQKYIDAATRQGLSLADSPALQKMLASATNSQGYFLQQGAKANDPRVRAYQAVIDKVNAFSKPTESQSPAVNPGVTDPSKTAAPLDVMHPRAIESFETKIQDSLNKQLRAPGSGRNGSNDSIAIQEQATQLKNLYGQYMNGGLSVRDAKDFQKLLNQFGIK